MVNRRFTPRALLLAAFALVLASCEPASDVLAPIEEPAVEQAPQLLLPGRPEFKQTELGDDGRPITVAEIQDGATLAHSIDPAVGGVLLIQANPNGPACTHDDLSGCHILEVPAGATQQTTIFTIERVAGGNVHVELEATLNAAGATSNGVGAAGFEIPVVLGLNVSAFGLTPADMAVAEKKSDGSYEGVPSATGDHWVWGQLEHFSGYIVVQL